MDTSTFNSITSELTPLTYYGNPNAVSDYLTLKKILKAKKRMFEEKYKKHKNAYMAEIMYNRFEVEANSYTTKQLNDLWESISEQI